MTFSAGQALKATCSAWNAGRRGGLGAGEAAAAAGRGDLPDHVPRQLPVHAPSARPHGVTPMSVCGFGQRISGSRMAQLAVASCGRQSSLVTEDEHYLA